MDDDKRHWLLITSYGVWGQLQRHGFWGFSERFKNRVGTINNGDIGIVYLTKDGGKYESAIGGIIELSGKATTIEKMESPFDALYPIRMTIRVKEVYDPPLPFKPLIQDLSFIILKDNYGASLQGQTLKEISARDFRTITDAYERMKA